MRDGIDLLTDREKEALRLLLAGHDAKSIASRLDLSIHTINERLRDARRKLTVSSSREAARILGEAEQAAPKSIGDKELGVSATPAEGAFTSRTDQPSPQPHRLLWLSGGMLIMSILIAAVVLSVAAFNGAGSGTAAQPVATEQPATDPVGQDAAKAWLAIVDQGRWEDSWKAAGPTFRGGVTAESWATQVAPVRKPLGAVRSRVVARAVATRSLPGVPTGDYQLIEFRTDFAARAGAMETVVLANEGGRWGVVGYFIR